MPKRLRSGIVEIQAGEANLFLTPGTDQCLELHTTQSLDELARRANQSAAGSKNLRSFSRLFYARAQQCDVDKQGRIRIPSELAKLANLEKELVFVGVGFHWEIWDLDRWQAYLSENDSAFDQIADVTFDALHSGMQNNTGQRDSKPEDSATSEFSTPKPK